MALNQGRKVYIYIDTADLADHAATPVWVKIAQQREGDLQRESDSADASHKDDNGWGAGVITKNQWSINVSGALDYADPAFLKLKERYDAQEVIWIKIDRTTATPAIPGAYDEEGTARITSFNEDFANDGLISYSMSLEGNGALVEL